MSEHDSSSLDIIKTVVLVLILVSFVLILIGFTTDLGQMKTFRFVLGEVAVVAAIASSFQRGEFIPFQIALWFTIASMNFAQATWLVAR